MTISTKRCDADRTDEVMAEVARYCKEHPRSPSATRRPRVMIRGNTVIALLGSTLQEGIAGMGGNVEAALRAFDMQYASSPRAPRR